MKTGPGVPEENATKEWTEDRWTASDHNSSSRDFSSGELKNKPNHINCRIEARVINLCKAGGIN